MRFKYLYPVYFFLLPFPLLAGGGSLPGGTLSLWWGLPFCGMLASLAFLPLLTAHFWEVHYGKVALGWSLVTLFSLIVVFGGTTTKTEILNTLIHHYFPFIIMIGALYTISGGIWIEVDSLSTPLINTCFLGVGTVLAGWIGTTGASMLLIRPLLHMTRNRINRVYPIIFFIFLVANIGGSLTPLGDPPLFLGFLNGISFFWPLKNLATETMLISFSLLLIFFIIDTYFTVKEGLAIKSKPLKIKVHGKLNGLLFVGVIILVLLSGMWNPALSFSIGGSSLELQNLVRDGGLVALATISWFFTPLRIHQANGFSWEPLKEVVKLFFGIFITVIPVIAILDAGHEGAMAPLIALVERDEQPQNAMYFWLSGGLSSFLDNAPTYLVFFHMAGGDAHLLMTSFSRTLEAISLGSVFMGAMTYIGNAPNFMVKTIAEGHRVPMPSFFGYMLWSLGTLLPIFLFLSWWRF